MSPAIRSPGGALGGFRLFCGVALLNALLAFPLLYTLYKHYDDAQTPMDTVAFMDMAAEGPAVANSPIRYRLLTPLIVQAMHVLPGYGIPVDYTSDPEVRKTFFHFLLLNFLFTIAASALLFVWLRGFVGPLSAWAGSLLYLFGFYTVNVNLIPMSDAACHLAVIGAILCLEREGFGARLTFMLVAVAGTLAKEAFLLLMVPWIVLHAIGLPKPVRVRKLLTGLALLLPALATYALVVTGLPQGSVEAGQAGGLGAAGDVYLGAEGSVRVQAGWDTWRAFRPGTYDRSFIFHTALAHLPLIVTLVFWIGWRAWSKVSPGLRSPAIPMNRSLAIFPLLLFFGVALGIGNNASRLAFMAFPAVALFQARVLEAVTARVAREAPPG